MIGILLALLSSLITGISMFVQKVSLIKINNWKQAISSPKWLFSLFLTIVSFFFFLLALKLERLIIIQPMTYTSFFIVVILEIFFLKEKLNLYEILAIILFFTGALFITNIFCFPFNIFCG